MELNITRKVDEKIYYWVLDQAHWSPNLISLIKNDLDYVIKPGSPLFELGVDGVTDILLDLFSAKLLLAISLPDCDEIEEDIYINSRYKPSLDRFIAKSFVPSRNEIKKNLNDRYENNDYGSPEKIFYFLTLKGGELWESVFKPKWNHYLNRSGDSEIGIVHCTDIDIGKQLIDVDNLLALEKEVTYNSIPGTERIEIISPFQVYYWKTLPVGYKISYENKIIHKESIALNPDLDRKIKQAEEWLRTICNWHHNEYFDEWLIN